MEVTSTVKYVGADDLTLDLFESQYPIPHGVSYNSYVILDEDTTVMDTVDQRASEAWQKNLKEVLGETKPAYLVVSHLEPDHAANIGWFLKEYPDTTVLCSAKAKAMLPQFFELDGTEKVRTVAEGEEISIGSHTLQFFMAPMVHWPEVMVTYEKSEKILFSADGFGTFGALSENLPWIEEARRYYTNIVGKYASPVQQLLKKAATLDIACIAPLHGPVLREDLGYYIEKYQKWSTYTPEESGILLAYASIHGNTKKAALAFAKELEEAGEKVETIDLTRVHASYGIEKAFQYDRMILAACTYDGGLFPPMEDFLNHLKAKALTGRKVGLIENGSWGPMAAKKMREQIETMKGMEVIETQVTIRSTRKDADADAFHILAEAMKAD
ncbi:MAG: FprA family A-type flavoprotein [Lachnospiraceae bacterium]|nr:FprA family A-type flavoprotein [Lachnospiraceae bacterium]MEE3355172.1 FprA family A-type flavoprotein [Candidatus Weimeria sp.]